MFLIKLVLYHLYLTYSSAAYSCGNSRGLAPHSKWSSIMGG